MSAAANPDHDVRPMNKHGAVLRDPPRLWVAFSGFYGCCYKLVVALFHGNLHPSNHTI